MSNLPKVCPHCGGTHFRAELTLTLSEDQLELLEELAARRKEDVVTFLIHLAVLEANSHGLREKAFNVFGLGWTSRRR